MLDILYNDAGIVAIAKPSGLLVHRTGMAADRETCMSLLRDQLGERVYPIHRLDRGTSGVLLFALSPERARTLSHLFRTRAVTKRYLAVARGWAPEAAYIDHPFTDPDEEITIDAQTMLRRLATVELPIPVGRYGTARYSLVLAEPVTGRRHQIRRHLAHISHPVIGDSTHGEGRQNRLFRERFGLRRLLLHASRLSFPHPERGEAIHITAPLPEELRVLFEEFGWRDAAAAPGEIEGWNHTLPPAIAAIRSGR